MAMLYEHMHCFRQIPDADAGAVARVRANYVRYFASTPPTA